MLLSCARSLSPSPVPLLALRHSLTRPHQARAVASAVVASAPNVAALPSDGPQELLGGAEAGLAPSAPRVVRLTGDLQRIDGELYVRAAPVVDLMRAEVGLRLQHAMRRVTIHNTLRRVKSKVPPPFGPPRLNLRVPNMLPALTPLVMDPTLSDADLIAADGKRRGKGRAITDAALSGLMSDAVYPVQMAGETRRVLEPAGPVAWVRQGILRGGLSLAQRRKGIVQDANQLVVPVVVEGFYPMGGRKFSSVRPIVS